MLSSYGLLLITNFTLDKLPRYFVTEAIKKVKMFLQILPFLIDNKPRFRMVRALDSLPEGPE